jgi:protein-disulfide isomerase
MMESKAQGPTASDSPSPRRSDPFALAVLVGVIVLLTISAVNVWTVRRLGERVGKIEAALGGVGKIEAALGGGRRSGPDPNRVYTVRTAGAPTKGPEAAPVTLVEFSEFQCPFCARFAPTLKQIEETYQGRVRIVWKHLPLAIHKDAVGAALAAEAARKQGKFWEYHDRLFENQNRLGPDDLKQHAKELQLDLKRFEADMLNADEKKRIDADVAEAGTLGIAGTPGIFINGRFIAGAQPFETFAKIIDEELTKRNLPVPSRPSSE